MAVSLSTAASFASLLDGARRPPFLSAELHPPDRPDPEILLQDARSLSDAGADLLFVPDATSGRTQWEAISAAALVRRETGILCVPHLNGRDRNAVAIEGLLIAAAATGLSAIKAVTGDPVDGTAGKGVYEWDSERIALGARELRLRTGADLSVVVGHRIGSAETAIEDSRLRRKVEAGAALAVLTPTLDPAALSEVVSRLRGLGVPLATSLVLVTSHEALTALTEDEPGFAAPEGLGAALGSAEDPEALLATGIAAAVAAAEAVKASVAGLHVASPHGRPGSAIPLLKALRLRL